MNNKLMEMFWLFVQAPYIPPPKIPDKFNFQNELVRMKLKNYNQRIVEILSEEKAIEILADIAKSDYQQHTITESVDILIEQRRVSGIYNELYEKVV